MTYGGSPTGSPGAEGDIEKKKWGYKREQFDAVIGHTRLNRAIERLLTGEVTADALLAILDELNGSPQKGRYMAEMLALKKESRELQAVPFSLAVSDFLIRGARRIPLLSEGLASQMAVTLAAAADNPAYLDTVNTAIGNLLFDLDHPLSPDTRNYLRALTDKIDATRRLQQARSHLTTVPSVYPPPVPVTDDSPAPAAMQALPPPVSEPPATTPAATAASERELRGASVAEPVAPDVIASDTRTLVMPTMEAPAAAVIAQAPAHAAWVEEELPRVTSERAAPLRSQPTMAGLGQPLSPEEVPEAFEPAPSSFREDALPQIPTKAFPWKWALVSLGAVTLLGAGYIAATYFWTLGGASQDHGASKSGKPAASASAAPQDGKAKRKGRDKSPAKTTASATAPPVTAKNAGLAEVRAQERAASQPAAITMPAVTQPVQVQPVERLPAAVHRVETKPVETKPVETKPVETKPVETKPVETKPVETKPVETKPVTTPARASATEPPMRTPTATRDIDQILSELRQIPNDVARIESKAQEISRIVARSARSEAEKILGRMIPEELLFGTESYDTRTLEPMRRVVALTLEKVALDKDDARAAMAITILGEWAKSRRHGGAAKLTLEQLAADPVVLSRLPRRQALDRVLRALGLSDEDVE